MSIATVGEFSQENHGGAYVHVHATVPSGLNLQFSEELCGPKSAANTGRRAEGSHAELTWTDLGGREWAIVK